MKKLISLFVTIIMFVTIFTACGDEKSKTTITTAKAKVTKAVSTTQTTETTVAVGDRTSPKVKVVSPATTKAKSKSTTAAKPSGDSRATNSTRTPTNPVPFPTVDDVKTLDPTPDSNTATRVSNNFKFGIWSNNVFTNSWSNFKFTLPNGYYRLSNSELADECGDDTAANGCDINSAENIHKVCLKDFEINLPDEKSTVEVYYDLDSESADYTEADYSAYISDIYADYSFKNLGSSNVSVGGLNYYITRYTLTSGGITVIQDFYLRKIENCMMIMVTTYDEASSSEMANFIKSITTAS